MKAWLLHFCIILLLLGLPLFLHSQEESYRVFTQTYDGEETAYVIIIDLEDDGKDEVLYISQPEKNNHDRRAKPRILLIDPQTFFAIEQINIDVFGYPHFRKDPATGEALFGVTHADGFDMLISEFNQDGELIRRKKIFSGIDNYKDGIWQTDAGVVGFQDVNADGIDDIYFAYVTAYDLEPRGIQILDGRNLNTISQMQHALLVHPYQYDLIDLDKDGTKEVVLSNYACNNGVVRNGFSDDRSYLTCFDYRLESVLSKTIIGGKYTSAIIAGYHDYDADGMLDCYVVKKVNNATLYEEEKIFIINPLTGALLKSLKSKQDLKAGPLLTDIDNNGSPELIVSNDAGFVLLYDDDLDIVGSIDLKQYGLMRGILVGHIDVEHDFNYEILIYSWETGQDHGHYLLFDTNLDFLGRTENSFSSLANRRFIAHDRFLSKNHYLFQSDEGMFKIKAIPIVFPGISPTMAIMAGLIILLTTLSAWLAIRGRKRRGNSQPETASLAVEDADIIQEVLHNIKTLLSVYSSDISYLRKQVDADNLDSRYTDVLGDMDSTFSSIMSQTKSLLTLTRISNKRTEAVDINQLMVSTADLAISGSKKEITLKTELDPELPPVDADREQITSVLLNLLDNGIKALPQEGGTITLTTETFEPLSGRNDNRSGKYVQFSIYDTGKGIDGKLLEKIFEPGYSTFESGQGIGLSICRRVMENHNGSLFAESFVGKGSVFHGRLPLEQKSG